MDARVTRRLRLRRCDIAPWPRLRYSGRCGVDLQSLTLCLTDPVLSLVFTPTYTVYVASV